MSSRRGVIYLSYDGVLDPLGQSQILPYVEGLASRGFRMGLVSFEKPDRLAETDAVRRVGSRLTETGIEWRPLRYHRRFSLASTALDIVQAYWAVPRMAVWSTAGLLHARSYVAGVMAHGLALLSGLRWIFDMRGFWIDERVEAGMWAEKGPTVFLARLAERRLLNDADALVLLTERGAREVGKLVPEGERSLPDRVIVPTCVDLERFEPARDREAIRRELGLGRGPIVVYAGSLSTWYLADLTLEVGREFAERTGGSFVVLTREMDLARDLAATVGADPVIRSVEYRDVPRWLSAADAGLALVRPSWAKTASAPTKVGEYLGCGLAVAATSGVGDLDRHFRGRDVAFTVDPRRDGPGEIADRLISAVDHPNRIGAARDLAMRHYDLEAGLDAYAELYRGVGSDEST